jgi:hypothetical protein
METPKERTVPQALRKQVTAAKKHAQATVLKQCNDPTGAWWEEKEAVALEQEAQAVLTPPGPLPLVRGGGEAICPHPLGHDESRDLAWFVDTLNTPDLVTATASLERLRLLSDVGCVELAQDTAETIQPRNSLERMLVGQLAAAHSAAMRFLAKSTTRLGPPTASLHSDFIETCRLATTAARFMSVFQEGLQTLAKLRTGGKQIVVVQHVHVNDGGQAVVAGEMTTGGARAVGGVSENGGTTPCTERSTPSGKRRAVARGHGKARSATSLPSTANGAVACTGDAAPAPHKAVSMP